MAYTPPNVYYASTFNGTYTALDGVQSVDIKRGKSRFQDPFTATQCSIELIPQSTFPSMTVGQFIDIRDANSGSSSAYFVGKITDIQRSYAIPYNSGTGAAPGDRVIITVTGGTGVLASGSGSSGYGAGIAVDATYTLMTGSMAITQVYTTTPQNIGYNYGVFGYPVNIGQNILPPDVAPWLDTINKVLNTIQYSADDLDLNRTFKNNPINIANVYAGVYFYPTGQTGKSISLVDDGSTGSTVYKYADIEYVSSVQSAFTQILVQYQSFVVGYTNVIADRKVGDPPYVGFSYPTVAATTTQANNLGDYVLTVNNQTSPVPFTVATSTTQSEGVAALGKLAECPIGTAVTVKFRGTTVIATVCGISASYYPDRANIRLSLTPSLGTPFTLDSSAFGILGGTGIIYNTPMDYNESGYIYNDNTADNGNRLGYP